MNRLDQKVSGMDVLVAAKAHTDWIPPADRTDLNRSLIQVLSTGQSEYVNPSNRIKDNRKAFRKRAGKGSRKKRKPNSNGWDRGSNFALLRKQADVQCRCFLEEMMFGTILMRELLLYQPIWLGERP